MSPLLREKSLCCRRETYSFSEMNDRPHPSSVFCHFSQPGYQASKPDMLFRLERGEEPRTVQEELHHVVCPELRKIDDSLQCHLQSQSVQKRVEQCCEHNMFVHIVNQSEGHFLLKQKFDMFEIHEKPLKSNLSFEKRSRGYNLKNCVELNGDGSSILHANPERLYTEIKLPVSTQPIIHKSVVIQQQRNHNVGKVQVCIECGKGFIKISELTDHQRVPTREKPHGCSLCGKAFPRKSNLTKHQRILPRLKQYECTECDKTFLKTSRLNIHQKIHLEEKPYLCSECGKAFIKKCWLIYHQRTHTGEKPYGCSLCGKTFSTKFSLNYP
nr:zinc finger protein 615-like [Desmodus rotundus]